MVLPRESINWMIDYFLAPTGAQEMLIFVCLFCVELSIFIFLVQTHFKSTQRALREQSESTQRAFRFDMMIDDIHQTAHTIQTYYLEAGSGVRGRRLSGFPCW